MKLEDMIIDFKPLIIIPIILLAISIIYIITNPAPNLDVDMKGGTQINIEVKDLPNIENLKQTLTEYNANVRTSSSLGKSTVIIDFDSNVNADDVINKLTKNGFVFKDYSIQTLSPTLSKSFFEQAQIALVFAFILMAVTVFFLFKIPLPSIYIIFVGFLDLFQAYVFSQMFGIKLSLATFAALLLIIGYSVDDNILLTSRVLKNKEGEYKEKLRSSIRTSFTMFITATSALVVLLLVSGNIVVVQISSVLLIGLVCDIINTWLINIPLVKWYAKKKGML